MVGEEESPVSTYDYYKKEGVDDEKIRQLVVDFEDLIGYCKTYIVTEAEYTKLTGNKAPPVDAFYRPDRKEMYIILRPERKSSPPRIWQLLAHEIGHHLHYPRSDKWEFYENATIMTALKRQNVHASFTALDHSFARTIVADIQNIIDDALINFLASFNEDVEDSLMYFGWFARSARSMYEAVLMDFDVSKKTPIISLGILHHKFMTALGWFYRGVDGPAPGAKGGYKFGEEPYRSLCEFECFSCGKTSATWDFKCEHCGAMNNTFGRTGHQTPSIGLLTDHRSPLVTTSNDRRVRDQYELMQKYFIWVCKLPFARRQSASKEDNVFFNIYYRELATYIGKLMKSGCVMPLMADYPKFLCQSLPVDVGGSQIDLAAKWQQSYKDRAIVQLTMSLLGMRSKHYKDLSNVLPKGLKPEDLLPDCGCDIMGVYDPESYESLGDWAQKDIDAVVRKLLAGLEKRAYAGALTQEQFEAELLQFILKQTPEERRLIVISMLDHVISFASMGIDVKKALAKIAVGSMLGGGTGEQ